MPSCIDDVRANTSSAVRPARRLKLYKTFPLRLPLALWRTERQRLSAVFCFSAHIIAVMPCGTSGLAVFHMWPLACGVRRIAADNTARVRLCLYRGF